ncbi:hypothetical protein BLA60_15875 [Actinophytocola xinjiangensis]|uniref:Uncharacterized protein n=1 Tax=Actinophytocola xinjiangensis TaxID=485602 RepID=A0A7Z1AYN7_9PSEU|nr:hypothetical protein BLA60_15875 [Actinophytocola xinjiangensis]
MTTRSSATFAITRRSWLTSSNAVPSRSRRPAISASTRAWVVTSSAVVGSSAMISRGSPASAIAIITRWRWPPDSSCG